MSGSIVGVVRGGVCWFTLVSRLGRCGVPDKWLSARDGHGPFIPQSLVSLDSI